MYSTLEEFFAALPPSSGSPTGFSYWSLIERCSHLAAEKLRGNPLIVDNAGDGARRGTYFHALWEHEVDAELPEGALDVNQVSAVKLYKAYKKFWGDPETRFGCVCIGREMLFAYDGITGRADRILQVVDPQPLRDLGAIVNAGDRLIHDFKTSDSKKNPSYYLRHFQGRFYPLVHNLANPQAPVVGILFDECIDHAVIRKVSEGKNKGPSYAVHWAPAPIAPEILWPAVKEWIVDQERRLQNPTRNLGGCLDKWDRECCLFNECHGGL